jgi:hypothetical protein
MNKIPFGIYVVALFIWGLIAIATSAAVWNSHPGTFLSIVAALNLAINGWCIYWKIKNIPPMQ